MQGDDPPYLTVGTAVSAKYKGAFCEAKVSKVVRIVKCKITFKMGLGTATVSDEAIRGTLRVGQLVSAKHPERKEYIDATITKIQDCSQYTVVFDDGDITTLRRSALCLKSGRHFNESETLDQLPLTHPEHFGNPVMGGRRGRRSRQLKEDSSDGEGEEENEPDLELYSADIGRVVVIEGSDKKRNKDNWFPGLIVIPSAQPTVRINVKDEFLVRSFRDGRYYTVPKKEITEFKRESKADSPSLIEAIDKAHKFLDNDELPAHWERNSLFNSQNQFSDSDENYSDSSDDEPTEEKDHFVAQLYKFMDDSGTPLNKTPTIANKDVDFYKLFRLVHKMGGYNRVSNQNKWKSVTGRLKLPQTQTAYNQVKQVYKKCLLGYESFYRTLGCTMLNPTRNAKKNRGRPLIRDKDRMTPVQSPKPEKKDEEEAPEVKKEEEKKEKEKEKEKDEEVAKTPKSKKPDKQSKVVDEEKDKKTIKKEVPVEGSSDSSDATDQSEVAGPSRESGRPKRTETKKDKKIKPVPGTVKALVEKFEEQSRKAEKEKEKEKERDIKEKEKDRDKDKEDDKEKEKDKQPQHTRSKSQTPKNKDKETKDKDSTPERKLQDGKPLKESKEKDSKQISKSSKKSSSDDDKEKKRGRKRNNQDEKEKTGSESSDSIQTSTTSKGVVNIGDKLKVYYGPTHESKVTYEAKVIEIDKDSSGQYAYLVHYTGWNNRYDEWINVSRIAENLSAATKAKRLKQSSTPSGLKSSPKPAGKRGRGMSITGRSTVQETPRSTTPSSVTSSSSRTKSPATPMSRSRSTRGESTRRTRRTSAHTDISIQSESDSDDDDRMESDVELTRTRSGNKSEENEPKFKRKLVKTKLEKRKDDDDTEKEDEDKEKIKKPRKFKKLAEIKSDSEDDAVLQPKGRDFDLLQIRSELKGFRKADVGTSASEVNEKDAGSSDDSANTTDNKDASETEPEEKKEKTIEKSSSSDDIYEFKEPEPFEFGSSRKIADEKGKKRVPRLFEEIEKSPPKKKSPKSPAKQEPKEECEKKQRFKKSPSTPKKIEEVIEEIETKPEVKEEKKEKSEDPFDKLVESPSFHVGKSTSTTPEKQQVVEKPKIENVAEALSMFDSPDFNEENSDDRLDLSDNEERVNELAFTRSSPLFTNFGKPSPDHMIETACDSFGPSKSKDIKQKDSEDDDDSNLQASIQRAQSTLTNSLEAVSPNTDSESSKAETSVITLNRIEPPAELKEEIIEDAKEKVVLPKQIQAVFQESDSSILEDLYNPPQIVSTKAEDLKDLNLKTGTKIADSILQKLTKNKEVTTKTTKVEESPTPSVIEEPKIEEHSPTISECKIETKIITLIDAPVNKSETKSISKIESKLEPTTSPSKSNKSEIKPKIQPKKPEPESKKRNYKKFVSPEFIEESDSESDDSDADHRLVIARSDEESESSISSDKPDADNEKASSPNETKVIKLMDLEPPEECTFTINECKIDEEECKTEEPEDDVKEEEPDSQLHSMLLCEETIPGSPAPAPQVETKPKPKAVMEMPFASAPSSSNSKNAMMQQQEKQASPSPIIMPLQNRDNRERERREENNTNTVLDNTPPTTPESTISNLSPRGEIGGLSPNNDIESCKSTEAEVDYSTQRRAAATKVTNYSEEDSLNCEPHTSSKKRDELPSPCKKRRRSCKGENEVPVKRGRKPNRSRHNSDSDDTSEHSMHGMLNFDTRVARSPRPMKYNFYVELDPNLDSAARIAVLQQKVQDLKKTYADIKAELVTIERRRKKIRRREREAMKAAKQEMTCA